MVRLRWVAFAGRIFCSDFYQASSLVAPASRRRVLMSRPRKIAGGTPALPNNPRVSHGPHFEGIENQGTFFHTNFIHSLSI